MVPTSATPPLLTVIPMKCPNCGADLQISQQMDNFACGYCGTSIHTVRQGGTISLLVDAVAKVQLATDRTAAELALKRLRKELDDLDKDILNLAVIPEPSRPEQPMKPMKWWNRMLMSDVSYMLYDGQRKSEESYRLEYFQRLQDWQTVQDKMQKLKATRAALVVKMTTYRKIVD